MAKSEDKDRLIFDRRPQNHGERRLGWARLPRSSQFTKVLLANSEVLRGSGDDLACFYYCLRHQQNWWAHNAVGRCVTGQVAADLGASPDRRYFACFRVFGMGDLNAVDMAQAVHEGVLRQEEALPVRCTLEYGRPVPTDRCWQGIYIDDLLITLRATRASLDREKEDLSALTAEECAEGLDSEAWCAAALDDRKAVARAERAYEKAGRAKNKSFRFSTRFKAWGAEVDGERGVIGSSIQGRRLLCEIIADVLSGGVASKKLLQEVMGHLKYAFTFRREFLCLAHHLHKYIDSLLEQGWFRLPAFVCDELRALGLHLVLAQTDLRRPLAEEVWATDATPTSGGSTVASLPPKLARVVFRRTEERGESVRLDWHEHEQVYSERLLPRDSDIDQLAACLDWRISGIYTFRRKAHVNLQEARAIVRQVRQSLKLGRYPRRQLVFCDSRVCVGAFSKGRSSSFRLNGVLRSLLPYLVLGGISLALIWVSTDYNPADGPSRLRDLDPPRPPPAWAAPWLIRRDAAKGLELFAGSGNLTRAHRMLGLEMHDPLDLLHGPESDIFSPRWEELLRAGLVAWLWLAPPCSSFSLLRNLRPEGPLRPKGNPAGDENEEEVALGNRLWLRALELLELATELGIPVTLEHPGVPVLGRCHRLSVGLIILALKWFTWICASFSRWELS